MTAGSDGRHLRALGWRQFSAISGELRASILDGLGLAAVDPLDVLMVSSHDCDVTHQSLEGEPSLELLLARKKPDGEEENGSLTYGKNPRRLQFRCPQDSGPVFEVVAHERFFVERVRLSAFTPDVTWGPSDRIKRIIASWLSRRYMRPAFPDTFNERIGKKSAEKMRAAMKTKGKFVHTVFAHVDPEIELTSDKPYDVTLVMTMAVDDYKNEAARMLADEALDRVKEILKKCAGIEVGDTSIASEAEFSLDDARLMKRLDFDDLSLRD
jgi:hypothetical protein